MRFIDPDGMKTRDSFEAGTEYSGQDATDLYNSLLGFFNYTNTYDGSAYISNSLAAFSSSGGGGGPFQLGISGIDAQAAFDLLEKSVEGQLKLTFKDGIVKGSAIEGVELTPAAAMLLEIINDPKIKATLQTVKGFYFYDTEIKKDFFLKAMHLEEVLFMTEKLWQIIILVPKFPKVMILHLKHQ